MSAWRAVPAEIGHDGGLGEGEVGWLAGQLVGCGDGVLGERTGRDAVDLVAGREVDHVGADFGDDAGDVSAGHGVPGSAQSHGEAYGVRLAGEEVLGAAVETGGVNADEDLVVADGRARHVGEAQHVCGAVAGLGDGSHRARPGGVAVGRGVLGGAGAHVVVLVLA